jgi:hypothetical protein
VLHRHLALVGVLGAGDYLLWNWSLGGDHYTLAVISGLTLPPLAIALIWLLALNLTRLLAHTARRPRARPDARHDAGPRAGEPADSSSGSWKDELVPGSDSSKLAA